MHNVGRLLGHVAFGIEDLNLKIKKKQMIGNARKIVMKTGIVVYERCVTWTNHANPVMSLYGWNFIIKTSFIEERKQQLN